MLGSGYSVLGSGYSPHGRVSGASEAAWREEMGACLLRAHWGARYPACPQQTRLLVLVS